MKSIVPIFTITILYSIQVTCQSFFSSDTSPKSTAKLDDTPKNQTSQQQPTLVPTPSPTPTPTPVPNISSTNDTSNQSNGSFSVTVFDFDVLNNPNLSQKPFSLTLIPLDQVLKSSCLNPDASEGQTRVDSVLKQSKRFDQCPSLNQTSNYLRDQLRPCVLISNLNNRDLWCPVCSKGLLTNQACTINAVYSSIGHDGCKLCVSSASSLVFSQMIFTLSLSLMIYFI